MVARAEAAEATRERILASAAALFAVRAYEQVSLEAIARLAGTTVQTVIRRFKSKDALLAEVIRRRRTVIHTERAQVRPGDVTHAVETLFTEYERWGDQILLFLTQEGRHPLITEAVEAGRDFHHRWVREVFAPAVIARSPVTRKRALHQITATTDLYTWKVLRRDLRLGAAEARDAMSGLVRAALAGEGSNDRGRARPRDTR